MNTNKPKSSRIGATEIGVDADGLKIYRTNMWTDISRDDSATFIYPYAAIVQCREQCGIIAGAVYSDCFIIRFAQKREIIRIKSGCDTCFDIPPFKAIMPIAHLSKYGVFRKKVVQSITELQNRGFIDDHVLDELTGYVTFSVVNVSLKIIRRAPF